MKKELAVIISALCMTAAISANADTMSGICGENLTWAFNDGTLTIDGTGDMAEFEYEYNIPWYEFRYYITEIDIADGVTSISDRAFAKTNVTGITIPDSVTRIGAQAFCECDEMTYAIIPDSISVIEDSTFHSCVNLVSVTIPETVETIRSNAFYHCRSLENVYYEGSEEDWSSIEFESKNLNNVTINYGRDISARIKDNYLLADVYFPQRKSPSVAIAVFYDESGRLTHVRQAPVDIGFTPDQFRGKGFVTIELGEIKYDTYRLFVL